MNSDGCQLFEQTQNTLVANVINPVFTDPTAIANSTITDPSVSNVTFSLAPKESALVTLRGTVPEATLQQIVENTTPVVVGQAVNTNSPTNTPPISPAGGILISTTTLPYAIAGASYTQVLQRIGGIAPVTWSVTSGTLPAGFSLNSSTGTITNASPVSNIPGVASFTVQVTDSAVPAQTDSRPLTLTVNSPNIVFVSQPADSIGGQTLAPVSVKVTDPTSAPLAGVSVTMAFGTSACPGATLSGATTATTNASGVGTFATLSIDRGRPGFTLKAFLTSQPGVGTFSTPFGVEGFCGTATAMSTAREWHTATRLSNGKVLIAGGSDGTVALATAELFDPATGAFTPTGSMSVARAFHSATLLADGTVLVVGGGSNFETGTLGSAERYDPSTGLFTPTGGLAGNTRQMHGAVRLNDGRVLVAGGFTNDSSIFGLATAEIYDPGTGTFSATAGNMTHDRLGDFTTTLLADGRALLAGGFQNSVGGPAQDGELFDPVSATFSASPIPMNARRGKHTAVLQTSGQVFLAGGENDLTFLSSTEYFDPTSSSFVSLPSQPALLTARESHTGTRLSDERFLEAGGQTLLLGVPTVIGSAEIYDPVSNAVSSTGSLVTARRLQTATALPDGTVLLTGGSGSSGVLSTAELFHPTVYVGLNPASPGLSISNVQLNGGGNALFLPGGGSFTLDHDFFIFNDPGCPTCIDQIEVGLANGLYQACTYDGVPGTAGVSGHGTTSLTVPASPGRYFVGFDNAQTYFCHQYPNWWNGPPGPKRYMAVVIVP